MYEASCGRSVAPLKLLNIPTINSVSLLPANTVKKGTAFYDESDGLIKYSDGSSWQILETSTGAGDISQGGNSFGVPVVIGANDSNEMQLKAYNVAKMILDSSGVKIPTGNKIYGEGDLLLDTNGSNIYSRVGGIDLLQMYFSFGIPILKTIGAGMNFDTSATGDIVFRHVGSEYMRWDQTNTRLRIANGSIYSPTVMTLNVPAPSWHEFRVNNTQTCRITSDQLIFPLGRYISADTGSTLALNAPTGQAVSSRINTVEKFQVNGNGWRVNGGADYTFYNNTSASGTVINLGTTPTASFRFTRSGINVLLEMTTDILGVVPTSGTTDLAVLAVIPTSYRPSAAKGNNLAAVMTGGENNQSRIQIFTNGDVVWKAPSPFWNSTTNLYTFSFSYTV